MIKRVGLVALALFLLLIPSLTEADSGILSNTACHSERSEESIDPSLSLRVTDKQANSEISVLDSSVEVHFPTALVFNLKAESDFDIVDARLHYCVNRMNYAQVTSEGWPDFSAATRVETSWVWDMRKSSLPPGADVTYWWTINDAAGDTVETSSNTINFNDIRYDWRSLTEGRITLFWYEGDDSFAQQLMDACQQGLARLEPIFNNDASRAEIKESAEVISMPIKVYVYDSASDLQEAMVFPQEWTGGVAFTEFSIIAIGISDSNVDWGKEALVHELTHLVVHQATFSPYGDLPVWIDEGLAMYNQGELGSYFQGYLDKAISKDKLISVRSLCSPFSAETEKACLSYAESYSLVEYLLTNYGQERMLNLLTLFREGSIYDEALMRAYGFDIDGLNALWRESLLSPDTVAVSEAKQPHPALVAVLSALATSLVLAGALALEDWDWQRTCKKAGDLV